MADSTEPRVAAPAGPPPVQASTPSSNSATSPATAPATAPPSGASTGPALAPAAAPPSTASAPTPGASPSSEAAPSAARVAPAIGSRIEVLWELESGEGAGREVETRWWGAVVQAAEPSASGPATHVLLYDAYGEFGEDVARVRFGAPGVLVDLARTAEPGGGELHWRAEEDGGDRGSGGGGDGVVAVDLRDDATMLGVMVGEDALRALGTLPADQQVEAAATYRAFADRVKPKLLALFAARGPGYVATPADIERVFAALRAEGALPAPGAGRAPPPPPSRSGL